MSNPSENLNKQCRRCSVCDGSTHHWLPDPLAPEDDEWEPGEYACKHCDQRGNGCGHCHGDGYIDGDESQPCRACEGEGVIALTDQEYDHEFYLRAEGA